VELNKADSSTTAIRSSHQGILSKK